ncbi:hypothetical protein IV203_005234 [Nitzschia inconspicua]|uniref:Uncharacterized protein n=1 Tax=Nitzschia inconspicua TaxID=303405 RepID=A0A9K3PGR4_9STRA|nr:hypothetical protein IV203_005234 [Nitzschia inconspicua]
MEEETMAKNRNMMERPSSANAKHPPSGASMGPPVGPYPPSSIQRNSTLDSPSSMPNNQYPQLQQPYGKPPPLGPGGYSSYHPQPMSYGHHQRSGSNGGFGAYPPPPHYHPQHYHPYARSTVPLVRSVVTHSFSMEEEQREDGSSRYSRRHAYNTPREEYRSPGAGRDDGGDNMDSRHSSGISPNSSSREGISNNDFEPPLPPPPHYEGGIPPPYGSRDLPPVPEEGDESRLPPQDVMILHRSPSSSVRIPPSPNGPPSVQRSHSTGSYLSAGGTPLKRSFWHHSRPMGLGEEFESTILPQEFMPPKRPKVTPPSSSRGGSRDYVITSRTGSADPLFGGPNVGDNIEVRNNNSSGNNSVVMGSPMAQSPTGSATHWGYTSRAMSWEAREDYYRRDPRSAPSWASRSPTGRDAPSAGSHWTEPPYMPSPRSRYDGGFTDIQTWGSSHRGSWGAPNPHDNGGYPAASHWPPSSSSRDAHDKHPREEREGYDGPTVDIGPGSAFDDGGMHFTIRPSTSSHDFGTDLPPAGSMPAPEMMPKTFNAIDSKDRPVNLLALPEDRISLSETLCIVRENIEVFTASVEDVEAPAPGRKHAVTVGQVGLRCIHCRHTTRSSERVKRAVCYPSSIKRIYRTVIDMKLDHFLHCKFVPQSLKDTLNALKANNTRSTGTTMQYFIRAATQLGMVDAPSGVRLADTAVAPMSAPFSPPSQAQSMGMPKLLTPPSVEKTTVAIKSPIESQISADKSDTSPGGNDFRIHRNSSMSSEGTTGNSVIMDDLTMPKETFEGHISLALPEDKMSLSPLRCFLRQQVCAFTATEQDIAVRTPTTFSVSIGQVGIGCIHCMHQPAKMRLNRAACFPFSIARIYQAVADIQRFHLSECKDVPKDVKDKFLELQSQSSKGSKGLATRQYWVTSAKKLGLADTPKGIRFIRDPAAPEQKPVSLDILAQVASHVTTVHRPLVLPEDKPYIAEFLYVVMDQLQACRFTEADRNKRRIKDVGCIGVECKHCAGQVDSRKFFWSSVNAVESNFVSVHTHMMECRLVPAELKEQLAELKKLRKEQTAALKTGSQKNFFSRVWKRLHEGEEEQKKTEMEHSNNGEAQKQQFVKAESRDEAETMEVTLSQAPMELTPTPTPESSPPTMDRPVAEIHLGGRSQSFEDVSDKLADVTMTESV